MKKILISLLMVLLLYMSGCSSKNTIVPLIIYNYSDPYMYQFNEYLMAEDTEGYNFESYDSQNSQLIQNEILEEVLKDNPQVLVINPVDRLGAYTIIEKAKLENIPIIFFNREPLEEDMNLWTKVYYVGAPAENSAILQAEIIMDIFGDPNNLNSLDLNGDNIIQLVLLKGEQGHQDAETRTEVVIFELENAGYELEILSLNICNWNTANAYETMKELLPIYGEQLELVISNNDAMAIGAINAMIELDFFDDLDQNGKIDRDTDTWIPVVGIDGIADAVVLIESGYLYGTVLNDSEKMAEAIAELTAALINGKDPNTISYILIDDKYIWIDYQKYVPNTN